MIYDWLQQFCIETLLKIDLCYFTTLQNSKLKHK